MRALMTAAAAALAMAAAGCAGTGEPSASNFERMKSACLIGAANEFDTTRGLITFAGDPVHHDDGNYTLDGTAQGAPGGTKAFRCFFNEQGHYYAVKSR